MNEPLLERIERDPPGDARASVIWLHGLGADGYDFDPIVPELGVAGELGVRFVLPHAPMQPVTINGGLLMRAWYDILDFDIRAGEDEAGLRRSEGLLRRLVEGERERGILPARVVLAGFSQGGAIALQAGLRYPERLAGILILSAYLPLARTLESEASPANRDVPVFMAHGTYDPIIPLAAADLSRKELERLGYPVEWHVYPMPHAVAPQEIRDIASWLRCVLA